MTPRVDSHNNNSIKVRFSRKCGYVCSYYRKLLYFIEFIYQRHPACISLFAVEPICHTFVIIFSELFVAVDVSSPLMLNLPQYFVLDGFPKVTRWTKKTIAYIDLTIEGYICLFVDIM